MTPATWGGYVIGALPYAGAEALRIILILTIPFALFGAIILAVRHWRRLAVITAARRRRRSQQAGLDHLAGIAADQQHGHAEAPTEAISMRAIVTRPQLEEICPGFCDNLFQVGDPGDCTCIGPCGRRWCTRLREQQRNPVPVEWERDKERGFR